MKQGKIRSKWADAYSDNPPTSVTKEEYGNIIKCFMLVLLQIVTKTGIQFKFPNRLGYFGVKKKKSKNRLVDWKATAEQGELVERTLLHSSG